MVRLGDICKFQSGGTPSKSNPDYFGGTIPWITTIALTGNIINETNAVQWITPKAIQETAAKIVPEYSIMVGTRVGVGKVAINSVPMSTSQDVVSLINIDSERWDKEYLCKLILSRNNYLLSQARGATIKGIKIDILAELIIPDVPLGEQRRIAATLDKVDNLISKRCQQLDKLDELVKARFVEMFGDPESNDKKWDLVTIGQVLASCEAGWSGNGTQRERKTGEIAVLKVSAVTKGFFIPEECKVLDDQNNIKKYIFPQKGDLIFSRANTREMVGATAVIWKDYPELILPDKLWKLQFCSCAKTLYMKYILSSKTIREKFSTASTGTSGSMYNVSMEKFKAVSIPIPPVELQDQFATFVEQTEKARSSISCSLEKLETLKKALMQEYFG